LQVAPATLPSASSKAGGALQPQQQSQPQQQQQSQQSQQQQQQQQVLALQSQQQSVQAAPLDKDAAARASLPSSLQELKLATCQLEDFEVGKVLGTGSFGRVSLARHRRTGMVCAIKALSKAHIVKNQQARPNAVAGGAALSKRQG
jgi:transcription initiation factor TFIID subunit TAF12